MSRAGGPLHHLGAGGARPGELDEVGVVDDGLGHLTRTLRQRQHLGRTRVLPPAQQHLRGQRCALGRLQQHRAARRQRADGVHQGVGHRVVPRRDDAHDVARAVVHGDLLDRQERQRRGPRLRRERLLHRLDVVRQDHDQQRNLLGRIDGRLARLLDQQRLDLVAVLAEPDGVAGKHLGAALGAAHLPLLLRLSQTGGDTRHVGGVGPTHLPGDGSGGRVPDAWSQPRANQLRASRSCSNVNHRCDLRRTRVDACQVRPPGPPRTPPHCQAATPRRCR